MIARSLTGVLVTVVVVALAIPAAGGGEIADDITVEVTPESLEVVLGGDFDIEITATNTGDTATPPLVLHIDITDPTSESSVDPEDWTPTLSKPIGALGPGESTSIGWNLQPISGGSYSLYAVVLSADSSTTSSSNVLSITVDDQRSLNPNGILPVAIGAPTLVGSLLVLQVRLSGRLDRRDDEE